MADVEGGKFSSLGPPPGAPTQAPPSAPPSHGKPKRAAPSKPLPPSPPGPGGQEEVPDKRTFIARELLSTEETYVDGLEGLITVFKVPLEGCLSKEDHMLLFQNIDPLLNFHKLLLQDLSGRLDTWGPESCVGDVLVKAIPYMKLYISYVNSFNKIQVVLESINQNPKAIQVFFSPPFINKNILFY